MGSLIKSSLSALSSVRANLAPVGLELDQFGRAYNGDFGFNFIAALSGVEDFKNLNFTNFYLSNNILLDNVTSFTGDASPNKTTILPNNFFSTLNFSQSGSNYLGFKISSEEPFKATEDTFNAQFYGSTLILTTKKIAPKFEITIVDDFTCRVAFLLNNFRYYLVVSDDQPEAHNLPPNTRYVLFVGENKLPLSGANLEYNITRYLDNSYLNLYTTKGDGKYILQSTGTKIIANNITSSAAEAGGLNEFFITQRSIKLDQETKITIPSPYNTSYVTYNSENEGIDNTKSDFNLTSNYILYSSSNDNTQNFNLINLKNIANNNDEFTSSNNLLSTSSTSIFAQDLRRYTSIFSDIHSEKAETLSLNYVYNNVDIKVRPGVTYFTAPSSLTPFKKININDTKFTDCGAFPFTQPWLSDRVYRLEDDGVKSEDATYLCTWLSGAMGKRGNWVDRYYYPNLISLSAALSANGTYNATYDDVIENLLKTNSGLKDSVINRLYFDKKSDFVFEINKRYKYERVTKEDFALVIPDNYFNQPAIADNYFRTINDNGGFVFGFTIDNNSDNFIIETDRNDIDAGITLTRNGNEIKLIFKVYDDSSEVVSHFNYLFNIDPYAKNNIILSFNASLGTFNLYLNTEIIYSFEVNVEQMIGKNILFGNFIMYGDNITTSTLPASRDIENVYLSLSPVDKDVELATVFNQNLNDIQDITISLPCGMRNLTDTIATINSINTNLKSKSNVIDINIKNLNINSNNIADEVKSLLWTSIRDAVPETTTINNINFIDYK
jgi:hypothetical protein